VGRAERTFLLFAAAALVVTLHACSDRDAPRPVNDLDNPPAAGAGVPRPPSSGATPPPSDVRAVTETPPPAPATTGLPAGVPDPAETGISDLARLARYVFLEMRLHEEQCPLSNPFHDRLSFAIETEVRGGRIVRVGLGEAVLERADERIPLPGGTPPAELVAFVDCLAPPLKAVDMKPAPADGVYEPVYSYPGHAGS